MLNRKYLKKITGMAHLETIKGLNAPKYDKGLLKRANHSVVETAIVFDLPTRYVIKALI